MANFQIEYSVQLANALSETVDLVFVVWDRLSPEAADSLRPSVSVVRLGSPGRSITARLAGQLAVATLTRRLRPEVVHFQNAYTWQTPFVPITSASTWFLTVHDPSPHEGNTDALAFPAMLTQLCRSDAFCVLGTAQKRQFLSRYRIDANRVWAIPHGEFSYLERFGRLPPREGHTVLFFGRVSAYKGIDCLLEAAAILERDAPDVRVRIVGEGDLSPYATQLSKLSNVDVRNQFVSAAEAVHEIGRASLVVAPYHETSQSGVIIAAQSLGRAVIASNVGGLAEDVRDGETGLLVEPRHPPELADAILDLMRQPDRLSQMGDAARRWMLRERTWDIVAKRTVEMYEAAR